MKKVRLYIQKEIEWESSSSNPLYPITRYRLMQETTTFFFFKKKEYLSRIYDVPIHFYDLQEAQEYLKKYIEAGKFPGQKEYQILDTYYYLKQ
jgi:hypothetical protein